MPYPYPIKFSRIRFSLCRRERRGPFSSPRPAGRDERMPDGDLNDLSTPSDGPCPARAAA